VVSIGKYRFGQPQGFDNTQELFVSKLPDGGAAYRVLRGEVDGRPALLVQNGRESSPVKAQAGEGAR
jgi:hypothetical protein